MKEEIGAEKVFRVMNRTSVNLLISMRKKLRDHFRSAAKEKVYESSAGDTPAVHLVKYSHEKRVK
jgi:hypothetical protein